MARPPNPEAPIIYRGIRVPTETWEAAGKKAKAEGTNRTQVMTHLMSGYVEQAYILPKTREKAQKVPHVERGIYVPERLWIGCKTQADRDGTSRSQAMRYLMDGYVRGVYEMPTLHVTRVYPKKGKKQ